MRACRYAIVSANPFMPDILLQQARYFCSLLRSWRERDGKFCLRHFYYYIVALFEMDAESIWAVKTLDWWDRLVLLGLVIISSHQYFRQVFGKGPRKFEDLLMQMEQAADTNSNFNALIAQRIARRAGVVDGVGDSSS